MSLRNNILASYASQIYVTLIGIGMVPFYVQYMGAEAYGLVGFFAMLQAWFQLLDMGLTPTMARETARFQGGGTDALNLRRLLRALEGVFVGVGLLGALLAVVGAPWVSLHWLKVQELPIAEVERAIMLMGLIVALRWMSGLYRGAINGFERLVWLSSFNVLMATLRFVVVIPLFIFVGATPTYFFVFQLIVAVAELAILVGKTYGLMPSLNGVVDDGRRWDWAPLRSVLKFSLAVAFTSAVWVLVTQTDKLVLSKLLSLSEYAYFSLAVLVASGVQVVSGPISSALMPRMTRLNSQGNHNSLNSIYRKATEFVCAISVSASIVLVMCAHQIIWAWTGQVDVADNTAPILRVYALGNGILALSAFPYYLQYSKGDLRLHMWGSLFFLMILFPLLFIFVEKYGAQGGGFAWLAANVGYFFFWIPLVHRRFLKGLHFVWLVMNVLRISFLSLMGVLLAYLFIFYANDRLFDRVQMALSVCFCGFVGLIFSAIGIRDVRDFICKKINACQ